MATYTPNYNLSKPESTDDYRDFLNSYGDNMDKIDNNMGGGGGGGHTIVDPTGTDMPQENKLQFTGAVSVSDDAVNGQTVVDVEGGGNYYLNTIYSTEEKKVGYWTDGKPLYQRTIIYETPFNITNGSWYESSAIYPDMNIVNSDIVNSVFAHYTGAIVTIENSKLVIGNQTKNQPMNNIKYVTIQYTKSTDTPELNPQTGGVIYLPTIYSEEEREIGVWTDGKPLYQKTWDFGSNVVFNSNAWTNTSISVSDFNIEKVIKASGLNNGGTYFGFIASNRDQAYVQILQTRNSQIQIRWLTLQYTKTTDVAGSGSWTPSGANAVHYSFTEHIVGTWFGETLWEKTIAYVSSAGQADTDKVIDTSIRHGTNCYVVDLQGIQTYGYLRNNGTSPTPNATSDPEPLSQGTLYLPYYGGSSMNSAHIYLYNDGIHFKKRGGSANANSIILTVRYVKI